MGQIGRPAEDQADCRGSDDGSEVLEHGANSKSRAEGASFDHVRQSTPEDDSVGCVAESEDDEGKQTDPTPLTVWQANLDNVCSNHQN